MGRNRDRWMPQNWGDYLRDTRHLSTEQHGAYLLLIGHYWTTGSLPDSDQQLARICGLDIRRWRAHRSTIHALFRHPPEAPNPWWHKRIEHEIIVAQDASQRAKAKAEARWKKDAPAYAAALPQDDNGICCDDAAPMQRPQDHKTTRPQKESPSLLEQYGAILRDLYPKRFATDDIVTHRALQEMERTLPPPAEFRAALEEWVNSEEWKKKGGQFIKSPANFIREEKWKSHPASSGSTTNGDHIADKLKTKVYVTRRLYENEIAKTLPKGDERIYGVREALERAETMDQLDEVRTAWLPAS